MWWYPYRYCPYLDGMTFELVVSVRFAWTVCIFPNCMLSISPLYWLNTYVAGGIYKQKPRYKLYTVTLHFFLHTDLSSMASH